MSSKETTMYKIYGDYGYTSECLLKECDTRGEALRWADRYVEDGFGGYAVIEVARFEEDGEYTVIQKYRAEDYEEDFYEGDDDFALIDEF
jgi:hypothetical protein